MPVRLRMIRLFVSATASVAGVGCGLLPVHHPVSKQVQQFPERPKHAPEFERLTRRVSQTGTVEQATFEESAIPQLMSLDELVAVAILKNPRIAKATIEIDASQGRYIQAGLYPNPVLAITGDELGDRTGPVGIWTAPQLSQEIVTGRKLSLAQAVVATEVNQATLIVLAERYAVIANVRAAYYELYTLQQRIKVLDDLVRIADETVANGKKLLANQQIARLDLIQLEVQREQFHAEAEATKSELPGARRTLAASVGDPGLAIGEVSGPFDTVPTYQQDQALDIILVTHPNVRIARVGIERAQAAVRRAEAEPIPNVTVSSGYTYQGQNRSNDWLIGLSAPIPVWNRNQGNIRAAQAALGVAAQEVGRVENTLTEQASEAFRKYAAALRRAELYRSEILPRAQESLELSLRAFNGGQFEYLRVVQAQRSVAEAKLEYNTSLGQAWKAGAIISGLLLDEFWPGPAPAPILPPGPGAGPAVIPTPSIGKGNSDPRNDGQAN